MPGGQAMEYIQARPDADRIRLVSPLALTILGMSFNVPSRS